MNFSQTMRSLDMDQAHFSLFGLIFILLLLVAWLAWFLLARIDQYETSQPVQLPLEEAIVVDFPPESLERIRPGQPAVLHVANQQQRSQTKIPAEVMDVTLGDDSQTQVWLQPHLDNSFLLDPQENIVNQVDVEIGRISPVTLLKQSYPSR